MELKMWGIEQCLPYSIKATSKGFSKYLFYGEDTVWKHLSSCPHAAVMEIRGGPARKGVGFLQKDLERHQPLRGALGGQPLCPTGRRTVAQRGSAAQPKAHTGSLGG